MRKNILFFSVFVLFVSAACGITGSFGFRSMTGSGVIITESRLVSGFERVEVCCGMDLYLTQGETESLEIETDDNLMDEITTTVVDGTLDIKYKRVNNVNYQPTQAVRLYLNAVNMQGISISGGGYLESSSINSQAFDLNMSGGNDAMIAGLTSGDIDVNISGGGEMKAGSIEGDRVMINFSGGSDAQIEDLMASGLDVSNSGGGNFEIDSCQLDHLDLNFSGGSDADILALSAENLNVNASGGGDIKITGIVTEQDISLSGGSSFEAGDLQSEHTTFSASGGGDSTVWATETLSVQLMSDSDLAYYGQPQIFNPSFSGDSELTPLDARE